MAVDGRSPGRFIGWLVLLIVLIGLVAAFFAFNIDEFAKYHFYKLTYKQSENATDTDFEGCYPLEPGRICVSMDIRAFTLYAFWHAVDGETAASGYKSQEAMQLEGDIEQRMPSVPASRVKRWKDFYKSHPYGLYNYLYYVLSLGKPPEFRYVVPKPDIEESGFFMLGGFSKILGDFYNAMQIGDLYDWHEKAGLFRVVEGYDLEAMGNQRKFADRYMRLSEFSSSTRSLVVMPMPYESKDTAYSITYGNLTYIIEGPYYSDGGLNWHEYIHAFVGPAVRRSIWAYQSKFNDVFQSVRKQSYIAGSYESLDSFVGECIVRAIDHKMQVAFAPVWARESLRRRFAEIEKDEVLNGLVLIPYFASGLQSYETEDAMDIASFVKKSLASYSQ